MKLKDKMRERGGKGDKGMVPPNYDHSSSQPSSSSNGNSNSAAAVGGAVGGATGITPSQSILDQLGLGDAGQSLNNSQFQVDQAQLEADKRAVYK